MDLCSGNGVIPLLLSHKGNQFIEGIEIQEQLVHMAKSIAHNHLTDRIHMYHMDLKQTSYSIVLLHAILLILKSINNFNIRHEIMCTLDDCCFEARHLLKEGGRF